MNNLNQALSHLQNDLDPAETNDWLESIESILENEGPERTHFILEKMVESIRRKGHYLPFSLNTAYVNTISPEDEEKSHGDFKLEKRIRQINRWNAMAMVVRANKSEDDLGGHISSYASSSTLYEVGFTDFWRGVDHPSGGDLIYIQGHSSPGIYARAFLEGRLSEKQINNFRREIDGQGISSYPHPRLMPQFWQFPTVSMGLGPIQAIYQARFLKYLHARKLANSADRKVWAFMGDGEMDEPESLGALTLASRENLDNLIFVINCNLQRLDGPVRGNGKIIQELEQDFRGEGWNVIKLIWGSYWDGLLARDYDGTLKQVMDETVDGEYQNCKANDGEYVRKNFFGKHPKLLQLVSNMNDSDIWRLNRGGHDPHKIYAAYARAVKHQGQPTVILAKTVKGYGLGSVAEGKNTTHSQKKLDMQSLIHYRNRLEIPYKDQELEKIPFYKPDEKDPIFNYLHQKRQELGGYIPSRRTSSKPNRSISIKVFDNFMQASARPMSTTMAYVRILTAILRDQEVGKLIVPIVPDEARTFGMEGLFRQLGIYSSEGQLYTPVDKDQIMYYREDKAGQILEEGINEAGSMCSWIAAGTAYSTCNINTIPFYTFYSMFGFQRTGDLAWAAGDLQTRGFLIGGTSGRTTLNGEGLQHQDGHSHILASTIPNCIAYDPTYAYELAIIIQRGIKNLVELQKNQFYYITIMNENYSHPAIPKTKGIEDAIIKGMYQLTAGDNKSSKKVQLLGSGAILRECEQAAILLKKDWNVTADIWSVTSYNQLHRDGNEITRYNLLHPETKNKKAYVTELLENTKGPIISATDYMRLYSEQIRAFMPANRIYKTLGTDGFGRSDSRSKLRNFFEVDRYWITLSALNALVEEKTIDKKVISSAIKKYGIDPKKPNPLYS